MTPLPLPVAKREYDAARARMLRAAVSIARDLEHLADHAAEREARAAVFEALVSEVGQKYEALPWLPSRRGRRVQLVRRLQ